MARCSRLVVLRHFSYWHFSLRLTCCITTSEPHNFLISFIYAKSTGSNRKPLRDSLLDIQARASNSHWMVGGDFNVVSELAGRVLVVVIVILRLLLILILLLLMPFF